jgi:hypothetical protein
MNGLSNIVTDRVLHAIADSSPSGAFEGDARRAPATGGFIAESERDHGGRCSQMRVDGFAERADALAMDHANGMQPATLALAEILIEETSDVSRTESVQIEFSVDRDRDGVVCFLRHDAGIVVGGSHSATKNPPLARRVLRHTHN